MQISHVHIKNFRSCVDISLDLNSFNAFIGYNNAGKSNCLRAIKWALTPNAKPTYDDFNDKDQQIEVEITFTDVDQNLVTNNEKLSESQKTKFNDVIRDGTLRIRKCFKRGQDKTPIYEFFDHESNDWIENKTGFNNALVPILPKVIHIGAMENAVEDSTK